MTRMLGIAIGLLLLAPRLAIADDSSNDDQTRRGACQAYQAMMKLCSAPGAMDNPQCDQLTELAQKCSMAGGSNTDDQGLYRGN